MVRIRTARSDISLATLYAPPEAASTRKFQAFWQEVEQGLARMPQRTTLIWGGDLNAAIGPPGPSAARLSHRSAAVGAHGCPKECGKGRLVRLLCEHWALRVESPSSGADF